MTASYDPSLLASSSRDQLRMLVQDVGEPFLFQNEELDFVLGLVGGLYTTASDLCTALQARFAQEVDIADEAALERAGQRAENYRKLAAAYALRARQLGEAPSAAAATAASAAVAAAPWFGGGSLAEIRDSYRDRDRPPQAFSSTEEAFSPWRRHWHGS